MSKLDSASCPSHIRASFLHFFADPSESSVLDSYEYLEDGLLSVLDGKVVSLEAYDPQKHHQLDYTDYSGNIVMPGFIDTHVHFPQTEMMAAYGEQLLEWLENYTFPTELQYKDRQYAAEMADFFLDQLFRHGTTTALVFGTVHPQSVDALFEKARAINMRIIAGKVMMDRNAPADLCDTPESGYHDSRKLIEKWHNIGRLQYAITPRFAPTSSPEQLKLAGKLKAEFPDVYIHTHLCENHQEIKWVESLYPTNSGYLDVYHHHGLTGDKSVFAHCLHLTDDEWQTMENTDSVIAFCPTSNFFLGSGLFKWSKAKQHKLRIGLGSDVGAGTSFSQLQTLSEAYKVMQLQGEKLSPLQGLYQATLGGAHALSIDGHVGNFLPGKEADFIVVDPNATPLQALRQSRSRSLIDQLFALMMLGDDRNIKATYVDGTVVYQRD
jgi:guanine deaminase